MWGSHPRLRTVPDAVEERDRAEVDEKSQIQALGRTVPIPPMQPGKVEEVPGRFPVCAAATCAPHTHEYPL